MEETLEWLQGHEKAKKSSGGDSNGLYMVGILFLFLIMVWGLYVIFCCGGSGNIVSDVIEGKNVVTPDGGESASPTPCSTPSSCTSSAEGSPLPCGSGKATPVKVSTPPAVNSKILSPSNLLSK